MSSRNCKFHKKGHCRAKTSCIFNHIIPHCPQGRFCPQKSDCQFRHVKICPLFPKCHYPICSYYHPPPSLALQIPPLFPHPPPNLLDNPPILPTRPALPPPILQTPAHPGWGEPGMDTEKNCQNTAIVTHQEEAKNLDNKQKVSIKDLQSKLLGFEAELEEYRKRACQDKQITTKLTTFIQMAEEWQTTLNDLTNTTQGLEKKVTSNVHNWFKDLELKMQQKVEGYLSGAISELVTKEEVANLKEMAALETKPIDLPDNGDLSINTQDLKQEVMDDLQQNLKNRVNGLD